MATKKDSINSLRNLLAEHCRKDNEQFVFNSQSFIADWTKKHGANYIFVFKKNLEITNIQYAEIMSLIRESITCTLDDHESCAPHSVMFHTSDDLANTIALAMESLSSCSSLHYTNVADFCAETYFDLIAHSVVLDSYHCSCNVALPPHFKLDIQRVCALSSYIHSCGPAVFIEAVDSASGKRMRDKLQHYLDRLSKSGIRVNDLPFIPYTHEDFSPNDNKRPITLQKLSSGLEKMKLRLGKLHVDNEPITNFLNELSTNFLGRIKVMRPKEAGTFSSRGSIWLVADFNIQSGNIRERGKRQYYVCYDQHYYNDNPLEIFDEEKPAWKAHTTTPHMLIGAMLSCTKPWRQKPVLVADPFGGTGTTFFEGLRHAKAEVSISDLDAAFTQLTKDNLDLLAATDARLESLISSFDDVTALIEKIAPANVDFSALSAMDPPKDNKAQARTFRMLLRPLDAIGHLSKEGKWAFQEVDERQIASLQSMSISEKLIFYALLRSNNRYFTTIGWGAKSHKDALLDELRDMRERLRELARWRARNKRRSEGRAVDDDSYCVLTGKYSESVCVPQEVFEVALSVFDRSLSSGAISIRNALELPRDAYDVIIADPPYGFNTNEDPTGLAKLYHELIPTLIGALRPGGQLLMCLPMVSFTGKKIPHSALKDFVVPQILLAAQLQGRNVQSPATMLPAPFTRTLAPYYWIAEKALGRWILHFSIN